MRVVVTRPQPQGKHTADALAARGHDVWEVPLMRIEPIEADVSGAWGGVVMTSANAAAAITGNPAFATLCKLPLYAVGHRSADAAEDAGFTDVTSAGGALPDLVRLLRERAAAAAPLLYVAGEHRAADLIGELTANGIAAEMRIVYRAVAAPFPDEFIAALESGGDVQAVLHFSRRSAESYVAGAREAGVAEQALAVRHYCLSDQIAEPLIQAGANRVTVAPRPDEATLIELVPLPPG
jgi:uroporphyrinogen-III synthase